MTDKHATDADEGASEADDEEEFELEGLMDRAEGASVLRRLADGVESGSVELGRDEGPVTVPQEFETEVEYEEGGDEAELEVEFEWSLSDGKTASTEETEDEETEETETSDDETDDR